MEIHPSTILSVVSGNIPMANHNAAARNVFHAAQTKQAIGIYATNFNKRFDTFGFVQHYPQRAIINTRHAQYTGSDNMMNGANLIVAIMTYTGFNQEDSLIINKKSIERGLFHLSYYKSISASTKKISPYERIIFANPVKLRDKGIKVVGIKHANYNLINDEGIIKEGSYIPRGQNAIVIGMVLIQETLKEIKKGLFIEQIKETVYTDISIMSDESYYGIIDKVYIGSKTLDDDIKICKVRFLKIKKPEFGDKHSSRHGQKGVVGMILPEEQMPFTKDGIRPDLIVNPHAIPSRMTIGHLVECVYSKLCCLEGMLGDGTTFINLDYEGIYDNLEKHEYNKYGNEILYNGQTGRQMNTEIFIGPTYYFRLKHMVAEKINARGYGPKVQLTRQPTGGRRKSGGLRIGEMERDSLISHGISRFIKESMMERSDKYRWLVCKNCGTIPVYGNKIKNNFCNLCGNTETNIIETPYSMKLLTQEFEAMGIQMRLNCDHVEMPVDDIDLDVDLDLDINEEINEEADVKADVKPQKSFKDMIKVELKLNKNQLLEEIKKLNPDLKGLTSKKKEELLEIYKKLKEGNYDQQPKQKVVIKKTKEELTKEILMLYPEFKIKTNMNKEKLVEILNMKSEDVQALISKQKKKGGGCSGSDDDDSDDDDEETDSDECEEEETGGEGDEDEEDEEEDEEEEDEDEEEEEEEEEERRGGFKEEEEERRGIGGFKEEEEEEEERRGGFKEEEEEEERRGIGGFKEEEEEKKEEEEERRGGEEKKEEEEKEEDKTEGGNISEIKIINI